MFENNFSTESESNFFQPSPNPSPSPNLSSTKSESESSKNQPSPNSSPNSAEFPLSVSGVVCFPVVNIKSSATNHFLLVRIFLKRCIYVNFTNCLSSILSLSTTRILLCPKNNYKNRISTFVNVSLL